MNDNQNYYVCATGRTTSRVLNPPGGRTSFALGVDPSLSAPTTKPSVTTTTPAAATEAPKPAQAIQPATTATVQHSVAPAAHAIQQQKQPDTKPISANAFASGANINGAQVMTGRPTSRVLRPGGGGGPVSWTLG